MLPGHGRSVVASAPEARWQPRAGVRTEARACRRGGPQTGSFVKDHEMMSATLRFDYAAALS